MTINIDTWLANALAKEARISHFNCNIFCGKTTKLKKQFSSLIRKKYGESFLADADYIIIFTGETLARSDAKEKLFSLTDRALGENANSLTRGDFKVIEIEPADDHTSDEDIEQLDPTTDEVIKYNNKKINFIFVKITLN